ncbi:MAG: glycogen synthase [Verrucomicrobia bacterium]|nr:glycogen synthase [Verrucomicrobiota bacterium]
MYIVHIATELAPVAKVGGLADVIHGLSKELCRLGHHVEIILPKYDCLHYGDLKNLKVEHRELWSYEGPYRFNNTVWSATVDGLKVLFIEPHHPQYYFSRGAIYGCHDDVDRFTYFSRAAMEYLYKSDKHPDAIHVHDWPTALVPVLYKDMYLDLGYRAGGTVLTIHNMAHQGRCQLHNLSKAGLRGESYLSADKMQDPFALGEVNLLKGGIVYANKISTVSPNYEKEIQTAEGGFGLEDVLVKHRKKLKGILNGIDEEFWNPEKDPHLVQNYPTHGIDSARLPQVLEGKKENRRHLRTHLRLKESDAPIVASVSRLVPQKGPELIKHALERTLEKGGQFILLGSTPSQPIHKEFEKLQADLKNNENAVVLMDKDEALAHQIFAAADMFIIPSLFEPCGLTQLISLRYGTVPIARMTGGLSDTVFDIETSLRPMDERNGFAFDFPDKKGVDWAISRAMECFKREPQKWQTLMLNGMRQDFSWKSAAPEYLLLYQDLDTEEAQVKPKAKKVKSA